MILAGILSGLVGILKDAVQAVIDGFAAAVSALISSWPIGMPDLPTLTGDSHDLVLTMWGWALWTPLPIMSGITLFFFLVSVEILWQVLAIALRWAKVIGD
jgi:hypothetical protein